MLPQTSLESLSHSRQLLHSNHDEQEDTDLFGSSVHSYSLLFYSLIGWLSSTRAVRSPRGLRPTTSTLMDSPDKTLSIYNTNIPLFHLCSGTKN